MRTLLPLGLLLAVWLSPVRTAAGPPASSPSAPIQFSDVTASSLPDDVPLPYEEKGFKGLVDAIGSGVAVFDYDKDGRPDIFLAAGQPQDAGGFGDPPVHGRLLRQLAGGVFRDVTREAGLDVPAGACGVAVGDYDGDGWPDLFVTGRGGSRLFHNERNGTFRDVTGTSGIQGPSWGTTALFFDPHGNGRPDLFIGGFVEYDPSYRVFFKPDGFPAASAYMPSRSRLYHNNGNGSFSDVTRLAGLDQPMRVLGAVAADFDGDGKQDLYVACDGMQSALFLNDGKGNFRRLGPQSGVWYGEAGEGAGMHGVAVWPGLGGPPGIFATDTSYGAFFVPVRPNLYEDRTVKAGIAEPIAAAPSWGAVFEDFDADGVPDLFVTRGGKVDLQGAEDRVLRGHEDGTFEDVTDLAGAELRHRALGRACVAADLDGDGVLDIIETAIDRPLRILRGVPAAGRRFLRLKLHGKPPNTDAWGASVTLTSGGRSQTRQVVSGGYLCSEPQTLWFGLGAAGAVEKLEVHWPSGKAQAVAFSRKSGPGPGYGAAPAAATEPTGGVVEVSEE